MSDTNATARHTIQHLLGGGSPNGVPPEECGEWAPIVTQCYELFANAGGSEATKRYINGVLRSRDGKALQKLLAGHDNGEVPPGRWRLYPVTSLYQAPPIRWLIDKRVIANGTTFLYGPSGSGKSFLMLDYTIRIAIDNPDRSVIYIAPEGGSGYWKRANAWATHHEAELPHNLIFLLDAPRLDDPAERADLISMLTPYRPILVNIDTLARCAIGLDENSARDMGVFIDSTDTLRRTLECGISIVHHTGKSGTGYRGSSALIGAADVALEIQPDADLIRVECAKAKDDKVFEPEVYTLRTIDEWDSCVIVLASKRADLAGPMSRHERKILECLALGVFTDIGARKAQIQEVTSIPDGTIYRLLSSLKQRGFISQATKGDPYYISPAGQRIIDQLSR